MLSLLNAGMRQSNDRELMSMQDTTVITNKQKESAAITLMRTMLLKYAKEQGLSFEQTLKEFPHSKTFSALFDYETGIWREGPDYLRGLYLDEISGDHI